MLKRKWTNEEIKFLKENYGKMIYNEIAAVLKRSTQSVSGKARIMKLGENVLWKEGEIRFLERSYKNNIPPIKIAEFLNRSYCSVVYKAIRLGLKTQFEYRKPKYNEAFFDLWSSELAWLVGIILSDGSISAFNIKRYYVVLAMCDVDVVDKVKDSIGYTGNVYNRKIESGKILYQIKFHGRKAHQFFVDLGMDNHKSYTAKWPIGLPNEHVGHFLRGLLDGDGSVSFNKNGYPFARICGTESVVRSVAEHVGLHHTIHHNETKTNYIVQYTGDRAKKFLDFIYKDSIESMRMDRKYEIYLEAKKWHTSSSEIV